MNCVGRYSETRSISEGQKEKLLTRAPRLRALSGTAGQIAGSAKTVIEAAAGRPPGRRQEIATIV